MNESFVRLDPKSVENNTICCIVRKKPGHKGVDK